MGRYSFKSLNDRHRLKSEKKFYRELVSLLKDDEKLERANKYIDAIIDLIRRGYDQNKIKKTIPSGPISFDGAFEVAKSRISISGKFSRWDRLWMDSYSASYSTPESVARYRASRLASHDLVDVGSGAGMQSIFLSESCNVTSIEISALRCTMARLNAREYGFKPRKIINADYTSVMNSLDIDRDTVIFSDPLRPPTEQERTLKTLLPSPETVMDFVSGKTEKFVFDLPPQIRQDHVSIGGEMEYLSLDGAINRLTLYTGELGNSRASAVMLPQGLRVRGDPGEDNLRSANKPESYIFIPDISVVYANLLHRLKGYGNLSIIGKDTRRVLLTASEAPEFAFPGEVFRLVDSSGEVELVKKLKMNNCGKVIPRFHIQPDEYYTMRKEMERELTGERDIYLMKAGGKFLLCTRDDENMMRPLDYSITEKVKDTRQ